MKVFLLNQLFHAALGLLPVIGICALIIQDGVPTGFWGLGVTIGCLFFGCVYFSSVIIATWKTFKDQVVLRRRFDFSSEDRQYDLGALPLPCNLWLFFEKSTDFFFGSVTVKVGPEAKAQSVTTLSLERIQPTLRRWYCCRGRKYSYVWPKYFGTHFEPLCARLPNDEGIESQVWLDLSLRRNPEATGDGHGADEQDTVLVVVRSLS
jgi:hypothetical protein